MVSERENIIKLFDITKESDNFNRFVLTKMEKNKYILTVFKDDEMQFEVIFNKKTIIENYRSIENLIKSI